MAVKVTVTFKDRPDKVLVVNPQGIDGRVRAVHAMSLAVIQLTDEEWKQVLHYKLEDDFL